MDIDIKYEQVDITALNNFLLAYRNLDAEKEIFNLYSEIVVDSGMLRGYVKPLITDLQILDWEKDDENFFNAIWQSIAGFVSEVFENPKNIKWPQKFLSMET